MGGYAEKAIERGAVGVATVAADRVLGLHRDCDCGRLA